MVRRIPDSATPGCTNCTDLWAIDLIRGTNTRLTFGKGDPLPGGWSLDGARVLYYANPDGKYALYTKPASGVGNEEPLMNQAWVKFTYSPSLLTERESRFPYPRDLNRDGEATARSCSSPWREL